MLFPVALAAHVPVPVHAVAGLQPVNVNPLVDVAVNVVLKFAL